MVLEQFYVGWSLKNFLEMHGNENVLTYGDKQEIGNVTLLQKNTRTIICILSGPHGLKKYKLLTK